MAKEGTITVGGREFAFVRPTIAMLIEILKHDYENRFAGLDFKKIAEGGDEYERFKKLWFEFCDGIFQKSLLWKLLGRFGYLPKELRFSSLKMGEIVGIIQSFFAWQGGGQKPQDAPSGNS
jgi:hypothetical protein